MLFTQMSVWGEGKGVRLSGGLRNYSMTVSLISTKTLMGFRYLVSLWYFPNRISAG